MNRSLLLSVVLLLTACAPGREGDSDATDRLAIIDLQNRYVLAMDYFDADGYAAVFTEDGVLDWARGEVVGRAAIREFMASGTYDLRKMNFAPAQTPDGREWPSTVRHLVTNQVIEINGDTARAISYWMNYGNNADRRKIEWLSFGSWDDQYVKDRRPVVLQTPHDLQRRQPQPLHRRPTQPAAALTSPRNVAALALPHE